MSTRDRASRRSPNERAHAGRVRLPALIAVLVEIVLYTSLPSALLVGPRLVLPALALLLLVPIALVSRNQTRSSSNPIRMLAVALILLIAVVNTISLALLIHKIVTGEASDSTALLIAAAQIWLTNVISFALVFWELDRGGALARVTRPRDELAQADFRFPQDEDHDTIREVAMGSSAKADWRPAFVDYLYVSLTNSSAFSPTDTMPLTTRVKVLMGIEATEALMLSLLVVAQAVSLIGS
jgi:hypothetical protein